MAQDEFHRVKAEGAEREQERCGHAGHEFIYSCRSCERESELERKEMEG